MDSLVEEAVPGLSFAVFKRSIAVCFPFLKKRSTTILLTKVGPKSFFKAATEDHRCLPAHRCEPSRCNRVPPNLLRGRRHRGFGKSVHSGWYKRFGRPREDCRALFHRPG